MQGDRDRNGRQIRHAAEAYRAALPAAGVSAKRAITANNLAALAVERRYRDAVWYYNRAAGDPPECPTP